MKCSDLLRQLKKARIKVKRQDKGSHIILIKDNKSRFSFPFHGSDEMGKGMESKIKKWAGLK